MSPIKTSVLASLLLLCLNLNGMAVVTFDWAAVGNPGNDDDPQTGIGGVEENYRISKHEVTNSQYTEFLNAVAADDTNFLFSNHMELDTQGGIRRSGGIGNYSYAVKPGRGDNPVNFVSFFDVMRFVNWLENGQPTGNQGTGTTESGVYTIDTGTGEMRASNATFFIPSDYDAHQKGTTCAHLK